jgi:hypothetical protein
LLYIKSRYAVGGDGMNSKIDLLEAKERAEIDEHCQIIGKFLIWYGDVCNDKFTAAVWLIEGCKYCIEEVADILKEQFPLSSLIEIRQDPWLDAKHIDIEWSEQEYSWQDHDNQFNKRVVGTLELLSIA